MIFVKNSKFLSSLLFFEKGLDMYFYDVVYKKECLLHIVEKIAFVHRGQPKILVNSNFLSRQHDGRLLGLFLPQLCKFNLWLTEVFVVTNLIACNQHAYRFSLWRYFQPVWRTIFFQSTKFSPSDLHYDKIAWIWVEKKNSLTAGVVF